MQNNQEKIKHAKYVQHMQYKVAQYVFHFEQSHILTVYNSRYRTSLQTPTTLYSSPDKTIDGLTVHQRSLRHTSNAKAEVNWCHCCGMNGINHLLENGGEESQCFVNMTQKGQVTTVGEGKLLGMRNR